MSSSPKSHSSERTSIACERCRKRKIGCDRQNPCSKCTQAKAVCSFPTGGERQRPPSKQHLRALQCQVASLESFIQQLAASDDSSRQELLAKYAPSRHAERSPATLPSTPDTSAAPPSSEIILARTRDGRMKKLCARKSIQFFGGTSLFQLQLPTPAEGIPNGPSKVASSDTNGPSPMVVHIDDFVFRPFDDTCRSLMVLFFQNLYHYNMCVYREYFLRDYSNRGGPYYSDMLLYSICAVGALISENESHRALSAIFAKHAQSLLFESLELPELTTLQSLIILGQYEIGQGRSSKGWLLCGLACRLTHEMGLHLDPNNWNSGADLSVDREILRRVYWAVFIVDKQLSLFFGRPPALYPHEADVRNTIRIPYPPEWESLIDAYLSKGTSATAFEDGISTVGAFTHQVELSKIFHRMIADVFENRLSRTDSTAVTATVQQVHTALVKWLAALPQRLHWNQWTVGKVPPYVLHLHMVFHTGMIILHRPPQQHINDETIVGSEGVEICYESLAAILRLMRSYKRYYHFEMLPLDFVHTLSATTGVIFMKRHLEKSSWADNDIAKPLKQVLEAMEAIQSVWPCISEIKEGVLAAMNQVDRESSEDSEDYDMSWMDLLGHGLVPWANLGTSDAISSNVEDLGFLVTDDFLNGHEM